MTPTFFTAAATPVATVPAEPPLLGMARLMRRAFAGHDLVPLGTALIQRAADNDNDANALMDLSTVLQLQGLRELGLATLAQALKMRRLYELPAEQPPLLQVLALMGPGDLMANMPLPFLVERSDISLRLLYLQPGQPLPLPLPAHDVAIVAVSESDANRALLDELAALLPAWPKPVLIQPAAIARTSRSQAFRHLGGVPGLQMPASMRVPRTALQALAAGQARLGDLLPGGAFPIIVRPVDSHAGNGLAKVDAATDLAGYLVDSADTDFFISHFIDYRSADGLYRKYRIVIVDGVAYAGHMGVSAHWMIHYLNAGMTESAEKRAAEACFMREFDSGFARRHAAALAAIPQRLSLPYLVMDCAETAAGELLVFEVDPGCVVHSMDPVDLFPYKCEPMARVFAAFRALLLRATGAVG
jgi:hypothetical protein